MITVLNAAPNTGNQGVSALCLSAVAGLMARGAGPVAVADHGRGRRQADWGFGRVDLVGLTHSRRFWRMDSLRTVRALARMGGLISPTARVIAQSKAILDVSGGDSFTDLYGPHRFEAMVLTKRLALDNGIPLILLPQTLGPFRDPANLAVAVDILRAARGVWLRDLASFEFLKTALGADFDPARHRLGVDMAVALPQAAPRAPLPAQIAAWLAPDRDAPVAGLNVSGLLCSDPAAAQRTYGLAAPHTDQLDAIARAVLRADPAVRLLLISHVHRPLGDAESDLSAALALQGRLASEFGNRIEVVPGTPDAMELKGILARLDWFSGARMHATIGAFSSGVPTLGLGYSDKAYGVFAQCGIGAHVADLRQMDAASLAHAAATSFADRAAMRADLATRLPDVLARASAQMDEIVRQIGA